MPTGETAGFDDGRASAANALRRSVDAGQPGAKLLRRCAECGEYFSEKTLMYDLMITLQAEAPDILDLDAVEAGSGDPLAEIEQIVAGADDYDCEELADQVHEAYRFLVCPSCRARIHRMMKAKGHFLGIPDAT